MLTLEMRTILVTGASRGIGAACARACHAAGGRVIAHAAGEGAAFAALVRDLRLNDSEVILADLTGPGAGADLFAEAVRRAQRIDAVINNAGIYLASPLTGPSEDWADAWRRTLAVNLQAPADLCRAAVAHFRAHRQDGRGGRVINIASRAGHRGDGPDFAAYAASKGALLALTKTFARALSGENILFYALAPGWVETRMAPADVAARAQAVADIPLGRVASPGEVAAMAAFLLSDACVSATGATFDINGASYVR